MRDVRFLIIMAESWHQKFVNEDLGSDSSAEKDQEETRATFEAQLAGSVVDDDCCPRGGSAVNSLAH
jgi:hypothetical protein